ncbi:MAG: TRAP transporter substrate-binding protein [Pseudomonadota bacterium]
MFGPLSSRSRLAPFALLALLAAPAALATTATAAEVTLTLHHFLSPKSNTHANFLAPWAEAVETASDGRIEIKIFPSMTMGGKPPELYSQVRDGFADIVWTLPGYTPGVFPRIEVFELPTVHQGSATATNRAIQAIWPEVAADFEAVQPILVHVHAGNALHLRGEGARSPADLAGRRLRTPSRTGAFMIEAWGAEPVGMPVPALPQALAKGAVDGALLPFEVMPPLKLDQLTAVSVEGADASRFGTAIFLLAMNRARYESLPEDLRAVIDAHSGLALADRAGEVWDSAEEPGRAAQRASGGAILALSPDEKAAFDALGASAVERWIGESTTRGIDGQALVNAARAAVAAASP